MKVLITGASGGIGYEVTKYLANKGIEIIACDVKGANFPDNVTYYPLDITNIDDIEKLSNHLSNTNVTLDAIINVAGIFAIDSYIEVPNDVLDKIFSVNLFGVINVNKILHKNLSQNGRIIITTSEVAPLDPMPFNGIYNTTKTALDCYSQALRQELNLIGQKVVTVRPGAFNTNLQQGALLYTKQLSDKTILYKKQSSKFYNIVKKFMGTPQDPKKIAPIFYKATTAKRPKTIYKKHVNPLLKLLNVLPKKLQCFIVKTILK